MSHSMQNSLRTNTSQLRVHVENEDPLALADTLKIVSCPVCRAVYIPSWQQGREQASLALLEAAFLSICHFCFRCQRPACPQCWNPIHCACASCGEEAQLPFRSPVPSLEGLIFSCPAETSSARPAPRSFTCLRNGSFYFPDPAPRAKVSEEEEAPSSPITSMELPAIQEHAEPPVSFDPPWLREVLNQRQKEQTGGHVSRPTGQWTNSAAAWPVQTGSLNVSPHTSGPEWTQVSSALPPMPALPELSVENRTVEQQEQESDQEEDESISLFERIENVLIIVISALLLAIVLTLVLALSFPQMNTFFYQLIHIDIRTEILYLLQLR